MSCQEGIELYFHRDYSETVLVSRYHSGPEGYRHEAGDKQNIRPRCYRYSAIAFAKEQI